MSKMAVTHSAERTSPVGGSFVGVCRLCGAVGLTPADALKPCPNPTGRTKEEAVLDAIEGDTPERLATWASQGGSPDD